jgi:hypothetical protein
MVESGATCSIPGTKREESLDFLALRLPRARPVFGPILGVLTFLCGPFSILARAQVLETESARLLHAGSWKIGGNLEYQTSSDGEELAIPLEVEYGITDDWEFMVEPVPYTSIRPKAGPDASGLGDTEITLTRFLRSETERMPALALAGEVKIPTAKDDLIGTGEYDYTGYLIASKRFGNFDVHANLSYTFVGQPSGVDLKNIYGFALATVYRPDPGYEFFAEVLGNSSSGGEGDSSGGTTAVPEAASGEVVGTIGAGKFFTDRLLGFVGISDDNNGALQARLGFTLTF